MCVYTCEKVGFWLQNATLLNDPKIQQELGFTDFLSEVSASHVLQDKNHVPGPILLLVFI